MSHEALSIDWGYLQNVIQTTRETPRVGRVVQIVGLGIEADGPDASVGDVLFIESPGREPLTVEVVGFRAGRILLMPLGEMTGIAPGSLVISTGSSFRVPVSHNLLGRVLNGLGQPIDDAPPPRPEGFRLASADAPHPLRRSRIGNMLPLGIRAIDGLLTVGRGQRMGIFAGSGVGKSTLMGMVARGTAADVNVIALIGERGREVREFLERDLGPEGLARSVVVVATSDQPALVRVRGALVATAIAEFFRDAGKDVLLMMDSVTRFAMAQREVGLTAGEPPATKGYPPSTFALLPKLLERAGPAEKGTITGMYTVLVDGDDLNDPVADALRSILDGHIVLARRLAERNHYPAVDVLASVSRVMNEVTDSSQQQAAGAIRDLLSAHREAEDLIQIGAYERGSDVRVERALQHMPWIQGFLQQPSNELSNWSVTEQALNQFLQQTLVASEANGGEQGGKH